MGERFIVLYRIEGGEVKGDVTGVVTGERAGEMTGEWGTEGESCSTDGG